MPSLFNNKVLKATIDKHFGKIEDPRVERTRAHYLIENQLHWCLDVVFGEDDSRIRQGHSARNMSLMRRFTLNLLRQETSKASLTMKRYKAALDNDFLLKILADSGFI
jgi:hypothetical protein